MAQRRMFTPDIVQSDAFLEMAPSTQALYFQLGMRADDDGFVNPKMVMRMMGSSDDELKVLIAKRFVLPFESGVLVLKHWRMNNFVRKDRYTETTYLREKSKLLVRSNQSFTFTEDEDSRPIAEVPWKNDQEIRALGRGQPVVNQPSTQDRLGKDRLGKDSNTVAIATGFDAFWKSYPRKIGKPYARTAYVRATKKSSHTEIMKGLNVWLSSEDWVKDDGKFIPHPTTWLNQERWNDEPRKAKPRTADRFINDKK